MSLPIGGRHMAYYGSDVVVTEFVGTVGQPLLCSS